MKKETMDDEGQGKEEVGKIKGNVAWTQEREK